MNSSFDRTGYTLLRELVPQELIASLRCATEQALQSTHEAVLRAGSKAYGIRDLLRVCPAVIQFCKLPAVTEFVTSVLGEEFGAVRGLFFDKPPGRGWTLPWHRDRTVAVAELPEDLGRFKHPTSKVGIPHLTAPPELLHKMLTLRLSLDEMNSRNGPLVVLPGSHRISNRSIPSTGSDSPGDEDEDLNEFSSGQIYQQTCEAGDIFAMSPLLAHSSLNVAANCKQRRRVIHVEISSCRRPSEDLQWRDYVPLGVR